MIKETDITAISAFLQQFATKQEDRERLQSLLMAFGYKLPCPLSEVVSHSIQDTGGLK